MAAISGDKNFWIPKIGFLVLLVAFLFFLIGYGSPHWCQSDPMTTLRREHIGLWKFCVYASSGDETCSDFVDIIMGDWIKVAASFMTLSLFMFLGALGIGALMAFANEDNPKIFGLGMAMIGITGLFQIIGVAVFIARCDEYFRNREPDLWQNVTIMDWSGPIAIVAIILTFVSMPLFVIGNKNQAAQ